MCQWCLLTSTVVWTRSSECIWRLRLWRRKPRSRNLRKRRLHHLQKRRESKMEKNSSDPNNPKRPPTAFFVFMEEFRKSYKEAHPDSKGITLAAKEGGEKWKSLTDEEKKVYQDRAAGAEYEKAVEKYNAAEDGKAKKSSDKEEDAEEEKVKDSSDKEDDLEDKDDE